MKKQSLKLAAGLYFSAKLRGIPAIGIVQKEGDEYFLCQNVREGSQCQNKLGMLHSYTIKSGSETDLAKYGIDVTELRLFKSKPKNLKKIKIVAPLIISGHEVMFGDKGIKVGCTEVSSHMVFEVAKELKKRSKENGKKEKQS